MSGPGLERRYRRVLRLLPGYYRDRWEQDMAAAFLDSWLTGDPEEDEAVLQFCKPTWAEVASVAGLAVRLYLGGAGARAGTSPGARPYGARCSPSRWSRRHGALTCSCGRPGAAACSAGSPPRPLA